MRLIAATVVALLFPATANAATLIDFEAQGANAVNFLSPNVDRPQTLAIAGATFSGGKLVRTTEDFVADGAPADFTAAYTTMPYAGFANPLTIAFGSAVSSFSFQLVNNIAGSYSVTTNTGLSQSVTVGDYANQLISLSGSGITSVAIRYTTPLQSPSFDFAIDNVSFAAAVPEAPTWAMMVGGLGLLGGTLRRRRGTAAVSAA